MVQRLARGQTQVLIYFTVEEAMGCGHNKRKGVAFFGRENEKKNRQKDIPFHYLLTSTSLEPEYKLHYETYIFLPYASSYDSNCNGNNLLCHPQRSLHYLPLTAEAQE